MTKKVGGEFIKAGTYGCVFRPPLKCKDSTELVSQQPSLPSQPRRSLWGKFTRKRQDQTRHTDTHMQTAQQQPNQFSEGYISKLMTKKEANKEINEV